MPENWSNLFFSQCFLVHFRIKNQLTRKFNYWKFWNEIFKYVLQFWYQNSNMSNCKVLLTFLYSIVEKKNICTKDKVIELRSLDSV